MLGLTFSSKLDWGSYIISIAKTASKKIGALICSMKFLSPEVALYLYKSTIRQCMEYCFHIWAGALNCYFGKLQKQISKGCWSFTCCLSWTLGSSLKCGQLSLFYRYYFGRCSSELVELVLSVTVLRCYKDVYINTFFPHTVRLWYSLL